MLSLKDLNMGNWEEYGGLVMLSEMSYPEQIRTPKEEFLSVISEGGAVAKVALCGSRYAGNVMGFPLDRDDMTGYGLSEIPAEARVIYVFNLVIDPAFRGMGYGMALLRDFAATAASMGYSFLVGHFRPGSSLELVRRMGAVEKTVVPDWEGTSENYVLCYLNLERIKHAASLALRA